MRERDSQLQRDVEVDVETELEIAARERGFDSGRVGSAGAGLDSDAHTTQETTEAGRLRSRAGSLVSTGGLVVALVLSILGILVFGLIPLLPSLATGLIGIFVAGFVYGAATDTRRYLECALAGALAGGGSVLWSYLFLAILGVNPVLLAIGAGGGALAGAVGHYFGRDLRDGMTRDLGAGASERGPDF